MKVVAKFFLIFLLMLLFASACSPGSQDVEKDKSTETTQQKIPFLKDGKLVVLMSNNMASYYIFKGQPRGYEYEMLKLFCADNNLVLEIKVVKDANFLLDSLLAGKGDLAAGNLTITNERRKLVDFSPEVMRTRQVLVQRLPKKYKKLSKKQIESRLLRDALELDGKSVYVTEGSSYEKRLQNYAEENGLRIEVLGVASELGTDELVNMVADGEIDFTVVDENSARIHLGVYKNIDISVPLSLSQSIAWAIPKGHEDLKNLLTEWMTTHKNASKLKTIYNKYYGSKSDLRIRENFVDIQNGKISPYDNIIQKHAAYIEWDWLLLAAMINKESRFNANAKSPFGAVGLMQVLPKTGHRFGVDPALLTDPELNIKAGTRFLQYLDNYWTKRIADTAELKYFVLASYNAGQGHVLDAVLLAEKYGLNPNVWYDNVEVMMKNKSQPEYYNDPVAKRGFCNGVQTANYVNKVLSYYAFYKAFDSRKPAVALAY